MKIVCNICKTEKSISDCFSVVNGLYECKNTTVCSIILYDLEFYKKQKFDNLNHNTNQFNKAHNKEQLAYSKLKLVNKLLYDEEIDKDLYSMDSIYTHDDMFFEYLNTYGKWYNIPRKCKCGFSTECFDKKCEYKCYQRYAVEL